MHEPRAIWAPFQVMRGTRLDRHRLGSRPPLRRLDRHWDDRCDRLPSPLCPMEL